LRRRTTIIAVAGGRDSDHASISNQDPFRLDANPAVSRSIVPESSLTQTARDLQGLIENHADETEARCTMAAPVVDAFDQSGLFRLSIPKAIGGLEADVETVQAVCEEVSYADGATGWAYTQNTITGSYLAYIDPDVARPFAALRAGAGHFAPIGVAHEEDGGYRVSGNWQFASGSGHAEFMGGGALVMRDGEIVGMGPNGELPIIGFFVPADRATLKGNWDAMGLRGTGSYDYEIPETFVETAATWNITMSYAPHQSGGAMYGLGPQVYGSIGTCSWALGVASRALHEIADIAKAGRTRLGSPALRDQTEFQRDFGFHQTAIDGARIVLLAVINDAVDLIESGAEDALCIAAVGRCKAHANNVVTNVAKAATVFAWEASGSAGMRNPSVLQRCFRDMWIGAGHQVFDDRFYCEAAKPALGLEPSPF
jgi:alkylation response protein AidB-like acyl-CoA dehydrogenase